MDHCDIFREQIAIKFRGYGHALWEPDPGELYNHRSVEIGDVGFIRDGKFHRIFNALLPHDHPTHQNFGTPEGHEPLQIGIEKHIDIGELSPNDFCSRTVSRVSGGLNIFNSWPEGSVEASFESSRSRGAVLSLPVRARRENTIAIGKFGKWILKHIDHWFDFFQFRDFGVERMEDILLVTGCHHTRSWNNIVFLESQNGAQASIGVRVGSSGSEIKWEHSREQSCAVVINSGPEGDDLPENQCIFVKGFRAARFLGYFPWLKANAEPVPVPCSSSYEPRPDKQLISVPTLNSDPLHVMLKYIAEKQPQCDILLVHDDDLECINEASLESLQPDEFMAYLRSSLPRTHCSSYDLFASGDSSRSGAVNTGKVAMMYSERAREAFPPEPVAPSSAHSSKIPYIPSPSQGLSSQPCVTQPVHGLGSIAQGVRLPETAEPFPPLGKKSRTLVLCFDGTSNEYDATNTNVVKLYSILRKDRKDAQLCYYQAGIGTYFAPGIFSPLFRQTAKLLDEAFAWYLYDHVMGGYKFLMQNYDAGDKVCIFGFSRGAYTARALAGMLHKVGLLSKDNMEQIPFAYELYKSSGNEALARGFKETFSRVVPIDFVGVWDTVASVGVIMGRCLPFVDVNKTIRVFRHALSLDEHRTKFRPNLYHETPEEPVKTSKLEVTKPKTDELFETDVKEVWFAGCHTDVGGGSALDIAEHALSNIPLRWMIAQIVYSECDILFDFGAFDRWNIPRTIGLRGYPSGSMSENGSEPDSNKLDAQDAVQKITDQLKKQPLWWIFEILPLKYMYQDNHHRWNATWWPHFGRGRWVPLDPWFHTSVKRRLEDSKLRYIPRAQYKRGTETYVS